MKSISLIKVTPLISTFLLIICLCFSNQKENTQLKILFWNTPSLSLGTYLAISTGSGFIFSYMITNWLAIIGQSKPINSLEYKYDIKHEDSEEFNHTNHSSTYDNNLIERDYNDPSPTINASFRVIGRKERTNNNFNYKSNKYQCEDSIDYKEEYNEKSYKYKSNIEANSNTNDWDDESYAQW